MTLPYTRHTLIPTTASRKHVNNLRSKSMGVGFQGLFAADSRPFVATSACFYVRSGLSSSPVQLTVTSLILCHSRSRSYAAATAKSFITAITLTNFLARIAELAALIFIAASSIFARKSPQVWLTQLWLTATSRKVFTYELSH